VVVAPAASGYAVPEQTDAVQELKTMPTGRVRYYDVEKGFGFLSKDDGGEDVFVRAAALPAGVTTLKRGQHVEFGVIDGKKGEQALSLHLVEAPPSLSKQSRKSADQMAVIVEDLIKMLDGLGNGYRRGRHPDSTHAGKTAHVLRAVADELEL
jgi:CspA family cold shock protein